MSLKQKLFSNIVLRSMFANFGNRSAYSKVPGAFEPYFQYKIGAYQSDQYLYFPKEPFAVLYKNEIFNKLHEYTGYDVIRYLEFHFSAYPDRTDFSDQILRLWLPIDQKVLFPNQFALESQF